MNKKQQTELRAAILYIKSLGLDFEPNNFVFQDECDSIDIVYKPSNIKLQITSHDGGPNKLSRHNQYSWGVKLDEVIAEYVIKPIKKKFECYRGHGVSDVTLLIHTVNKPGRFGELEIDIKQNREIINEISKKSGFKNIYLVFDISEEVVAIY